MNIERISFISRSIFNQHSDTGAVHQHNSARDSESAVAFETEKKKQEHRQDQQPEQNDQPAQYLTQVPPSQESFEQNPDLLKHKLPEEQHLIDLRV